MEHNIIIYETFKAHFTQLRLSMETNDFSHFENCRKNASLKLASGEKYSKSNKTLLEVFDAVLLNNYISFVYLDELGKYFTMYSPSVNINYTFNNLFANVFLNIFKYVVVNRDIEKLKLISDGELLQFEYVKELDISNMSDVKVSDVLTTDSYEDFIMEMRRITSIYRPNNDRYEAGLSDFMQYSLYGTHNRNTPSTMREVLIKNNI